MKNTVELSDHFLVARRFFFHHRNTHGVSYHYHDPLPCGLYVHIHMQPHGYTGFTFLEDNKKLVKMTNTRTTPEDFSALWDIARTAIDKEVIFEACDRGVGRL